MRELMILIDKVSSVFEKVFVKVYIAIIAKKKKQINKRSLDNYYLILF